MKQRMRILGHDHEWPIISRGDGEIVVDFGRYVEFVPYNYQGEERWGPKYKLVSQVFLYREVDGNRVVRDPKDRVDADKV